MDFNDLSLVKLKLETEIKDFSCGDSIGEQDLNNFLFTKAKLYHKQLLATTYILENQDSTIAYFSIFNDSLRVQEELFASQNSLLRTLKEIVPHGKRHLEFFPAIKIGRLAVSSTIQKSGLGRTIVNYVISHAIDVNKSCACKFITIDAYAASLEFYEKLGFKYLTPKDSGKEERQMFLDLTPIINSI